MKYYNSIIGTILTLLLGIIAFFAQQQYGQIQLLSSQFTGHLIEHGRTDNDLAAVLKSVESMKYNQYILCRYGEQTWPGHDKCKVN